MPSVDFSKEDGRAILEEMIQTVVTTEEVEIEEEEEAEPLGPGRRPGLKVLFVETQIPIENLLDKLYQAASGSVRLRNLIDSYAIEIAPKGEGYWALLFRDRETARPVSFLVKVKEHAWEVYTVDRVDEVAKTFRRMVEDSEVLDMAWIPREKLDRVVEEMISPDAVSGFTARRNTAWSKKRVTVRVYGGDRSDLGIAREQFKSEPTSIYFKKTHSPQVALLGALIADGELRIDKIAPGSMDDFNEIESGMANQFIEKGYETLFGSYAGGIVGELGATTLRGDTGEFLGEVPKGYHALLFKIPAKYWSDAIESAIREVFLRGSEGTFFGYEISPTVCRSFDKTFGGAFTIRIDRDARTIVVNPISGTSEKSISNLAKVFIDRIEHSAKVESVHQVFG